VSSGGPTKPTTGPSAKKSAMPLKRSKGLWSDSLMATTTVQHEEDILPLQDFDPSFRANLEKYTGGNANERYPTSDDGAERTARMHIRGDLSTNRPGHFKRLDSEAKVGGGHGFEEVEDRI